MKFDYTVADPTGNITVLVTSPYTADSRREIIRRAFELVPDCEQVGFVMQDDSDPGRIRLEMMGYEFCGNATLSTAAWQAYQNGLNVGGETTVTVISSGVDAPLVVWVRRLDDAVPDGPRGLTAPAFEGTLMMPVPHIRSVRIGLGPGNAFCADCSGSLTAEYPIVHMDGISHMIAHQDDFTRGQAEKMVMRLASVLDIPALGIMLCSDPGDGSIAIQPLVYVTGSDTLFWENGCATGSTAVGWYLYSSEQDPDDLSSPFAADIRQPGGTIRITITDGRPYLTGRVVLRQRCSMQCASDQLI